MTARAAALLAFLLLGACTQSGPEPASASPQRAVADALEAACPNCPPPQPCDGCWVPGSGERWQYQLESRAGEHDATGGIDTDICRVPYGGDTCVHPDVFDIDLYVDPSVSGTRSTPNAAAVDAIHAEGGHVVCYVSAGTAERFRPDYQRFVAFDRACDGCLIGEPFSRRFPNERWLNVGNERGQRRFLLGVMRERAEKCADAGFDAVEWDVVDAYAQGRARTGWRISAREQLMYDTRLANIAHAERLAVALKNDLGQVDELLAYFDFAVNEQCFEFNECFRYEPFLEAGKAVFEVEYGTRLRDFCRAANRLGIGAIRKAGDFSLFATPWRPCR